MRALLIYPEKHEPKRAFIFSAAKHGKYTQMTSVEDDPGAGMEMSDKQLSIKRDYAPPTYHEATPLLSSIPEEIL